MPAALLRAIAWSTAVVVAAAAVLAALEAHSRLKRSGDLSFPAPILVYDRQLGYGYNPRHPSFLGGFRGGPVRTAKPDGVVRIFCLGESTTSCDLVDDSLTWPRQLQVCLDGRAGAGRFEVVNAAVGGYGSSQVLLQCRKVLPAYAPDYVILYLGWNGRGEYAGATDRRPPRIAGPRDNGWDIADKWLSNHSYFYLSRVHWRVEPFLRARRAPVDSLADFARMYDTEGFAQDLVQSVDAIRSLGATPILIRFPMFEKRVGERDDRFKRLFAERLAAIPEIGREKNIRLFDLYALFPDTPHGKAEFFLDEVHMTRRGCAIFAAALCDSLLGYHQSLRQGNAGTGIAGDTSQVKPVADPANRRH